jgi:hypothetical protein
MAHCPRLSPGREAPRRAALIRKPAREEWATKIGCLEAEALGVGLHDVAHGLCLDGAWRHPCPFQDPRFAPAPACGEGSGVEPVIRQVLAIARLRRSFGPRYLAPLSSGQMVISG